MAVSKRELQEAQFSTPSPALSRRDSTVITATLITLSHDLDKLLISTVLYRRCESAHQVIIGSYGSRVDMDVTLSYS